MLEVQLEIHHFFTYCFRSVPVGYMGHNPKIGSFYPQNGWFISWKIPQKWKISIIPKPELRGSWEDSLTKPPFGVTSAEVAIIIEVGGSAWM